MKSTLLLILLLLILFLAVPFAAAKSGSITLLTVSEGQDSLTGGTAELRLEIKPGEGHIFIDSLPLTKLDTQISTRFGNEIACSFLDMDCSGYDFFYTIRADSSIVGGPSAGAAITVLTISLLGDIPLRNDTVMTGTINSGGLIGPVAGISKKAEAARDAGYRRMLVPKFELLLITLNESNLTAPAENITGIEVIKVSNLEEALTHFSGRQFDNASGENIEISQSYTERMSQVAVQLCNRTQELNETVARKSFADDNDTVEMRNATADKYARGLEALGNGDFYSAASFCFSANLLLRQLQLSDYSNEQLDSLLDSIIQSITSYTDKVNKIELETISDLETFMVVIERLREAQLNLEGINLSNISSAQLAYSIERYNSAVSWSKLFGLPGTKLNLDRNFLQEACLTKISEAEERINYVNLYIPNPLPNDEELREAYLNFRNENFELCLFQASKVKAEANIIISGITIPRDQVDSYIEEKLAATKKVILKEESKGIFPVLGYSYYEYANSLKHSDKFSALTFSEYALELSNLDIYFPVKDGDQPRFMARRDDYYSFVYGMLIGFGFCMLLVAFYLKSAAKRAREEGMRGTGKVGKAEKKRTVVKRNGR